MKKSFYGKIMNFWNRHPKAVKILLPVVKISTLAVYVAYPTVSLYLLMNDPKRLVMFLLVPAFVFGFVTVLRKILDLPRPYALYGFTPILGNPRKTGCSCPSRHTASAVVIACACRWISAPLGLVMFLPAFVIAISRVLGGAHFPKDVILGAAIAMAASVLYLFA